LFYRVTKRLAGTDPALFIRGCLTDESGAPVELAPVHDQLQQFLSDHPRALVELPRDHGKSFQICGRVLWELGKNPALRVKIVCATDAIAAERSRFLRSAITDNPRMKYYFPHLKPAEPWTADAFTVARPADVIGPSVAAFGVGAGSTGTRADLLICDDVVDVRSLHSRAERDRVADYFTNNLMNLLEPDGRFWGLCTPWHRDDLNARLKKNGAYALFRRAIGPDFEPVWPEKWSVERLKARMEEIGTASFTRGYRLVPIAEDETPIRPAWVRLWSEPAEYDMLVLSVDPAVSTSAKADRSALVLLGRTSTANAAVEIHVLACTARRVSAPELMTLIDTFDREWNPAVILFESNAAFEAVRALLTKQARFGPKLRSVKQSVDKGARVAAFSVAVENGAFRLKGEGGEVDVGQAELFDEMTTFPFGEHDDLLDAAATGTAHLLDRREPRAW
jgi:predicted phage terminase large subunit-like protein